jgi:hypothetical protein
MSVKDRRPRLKKGRKAVFHDGLFVTINSSLSDEARGAMYGSYRSEE